MLYLRVCKVLPSPVPQGKRTGDGKLGIFWDDVSTLADFGVSPRGARLDWQVEAGAATEVGVPSHPVLRPASLDWRKALATVAT